MFIIYLFISAIILIIGMIIGTQNGTEFTNVYLLGWHFENIPLNLVMLESFILGIVVVMVIVIFHEIRLRYIIFNLKQQIKSLENEIVKLRQLPIDDMESKEQFTEKNIKEVNVEDKEA